jgi:hypothetical protein
MANLKGEVLKQSLRIVLRPVVKFCLRHSLTLQDILLELKTGLVEGAKDELKQLDAEPSASRISVMVGVHRKDVAQILAVNKNHSSSKGNLIAKIVGQWQLDRRFSSRGFPKALGCLGKESEFVELVRSVNSELNPYTILFEMERAGFVKRSENEVQLSAQEYVPSKSKQEIFALYDADGADLLSCIEQNSFTTTATPNLHLKTEFDNIPIDFLPRIREWSLKEGEKFHRRARAYLSKFDRDLNKVSPTLAGRARVAVATFSINEELKNKY